MLEQNKEIINKSLAQTVHQQYSSQYKCQLTHENVIFHEQ